MYAIVTAVLWAEGSSVYAIVKGCSLGGSSVYAIVTAVLWWTAVCTL